MIGLLFAFTGNTFMKKGNSGKPYTKPSITPALKMIKDNVIIEVFETYSLVEIYQRMNGHEQRMTMTPSDFDNFYNRLLQSGFVIQQ